MKQIVYFDMDDILCDFTAARKEYLNDCPDIKYPQCQMDFFRRLAPIKRGVRLFQKLSSHPELFDVYILTAPSVMNPMCYTEKRLWVEDHLGIASARKLIISPNKGLSIGDYLIDDQASGMGQDKFRGKLIQMPSSEFKDWDAVEYLFNKIIDKAS